MQRESGTQLVRALETLRANTWDTVINHLMIAKFDSATRREWESHIKDKEVVTVASLTEFLEERCSIIEPEAIKSFSGKSQSNNRVQNPKRAESSNTFVNTSGDSRVMRKCTFCGDEWHLMYACLKFKELTIPERLNAVNKRKLCRNCLRPNHFADKCQSSGCKRCNARHNTLLHPIEENVSAGNSATPSANETNSRSVQSEQVTSVNCSSVRIPMSSKSTARVLIYDIAQRTHECRVLLDSGSQSNFLTKECCEKLKLATQPFSCSVGGMSTTINLTEATSTVIKSRHTAYRATVKFLITERIIDELPPSQIEVGHLQISTNIKLADETFHVPGKIDMILGGGHFWELLCIGQIKLGRSQPVLQKTHLGWIISGNVAPNDHQGTSICSVSAERRLHDQVEKFWAIEEVDQKIAPSKNDAVCEEHFTQTHRRDEQRRFTVRLPLRGHPSELGESRSGALHRLFRLERKLEREPEVRERYTNFMSEYLNLGHMTAVDTRYDGSSIAHYIPHHAVITKINEQSKLRVVFDASAKTSTGKSLNDILRVGPTIQETLFSIILRFRQRQCVITADIVKMYRQINVQNDQRCLQRILWRSSSDMPVQEYQLNTVTYGLASAPFLAIRALHQAAHDARDSHPEASQVIVRDFYVDDLLTGHENLGKLREIKKNIATVLFSSGFEIAKWKSNEPALVDRNTDEFTRIVNIGEDVKTLGLSWEASKDTLQYRVIASDTSTRVTKRIVLSVVSQIFDPLGLVDPSTIRAKILIQKLWQLNLGRDESVPIELHTEWTTYVKELSAINDITIPRVIVCSDPMLVEVHGFSDASESAYGAWVYIRTVNYQVESTIRLVCAKSKVAPLKTSCVPRLELCGAVLLAKLVDAVTRALTTPVSDRYYWCDSMIVLACIHGEPHLRKTFVANRVIEIQQLTAREQWRHVRSEDNPADVISRGISPQQLKGLPLWWQGPKWLQHPEEHIHETIPRLIDEIPETRVQTMMATQVIGTNDILERFSSLIKLKRVIAYCLRWRDITKSQPSQRDRPLTVDELERAATTIFRMVQAAQFSQEISNLRSKQRVNNDSVLITLHPFLDDDELIRVGRAHDPTYSLYRLGEKLTTGATQYVETGRTDGLDTGGDSPNILNAFTGPPVPQGEGSSVARAFLDGNHSLVSVMARINPSPDWFVGVDSFQLCVEGNWVETVTVELDPLDGGTDNGFTFTAANWATRPQGIAYRITSRYPAHPAGSFYYPNLPRLPPIATLTFTKLKEYTLTETYHEDDIEVEFVSNLSQQPGAPTPRGIDPNRELNEAIAEERREMDTQRYRYWTTGISQQGGITAEPYDNEKAAIIESIVSSYPLPRSKFSQQVTQATYTMRQPENQIQQTQETRIELPDDKARHEGKKISSSSNYYRKAEIYDDIQRRIGNVTSPGGLGHRGKWTNSTLAAKKRQHRLRMKHHRLQSKGKRLRTRPSRDCKVDDWGPWSACSRTCGVGETQRTRKIRLSPRRGGATCPPLKETKWCGSASPCSPNSESGKPAVDLFQW